MNKFKRFLLTLLLFLIIFEPPILPFNPIHLVGIIALLYIAIFSHDIKKYFNVMKLLGLFFIISLLGIYVLIVALCNDNSVFHSLSFFYWLLYTIPFAVMVNYMVEKHGLDFNWFLETLIYAGLMQATLAMFAFANSSIKDYFIELLVNYGYGEVFYELSGVRLFGLASELNFTTPVTLSFLAVLSIYVGFTGKKYFYFFAPVLIFSALLNARTAMVVFFLGILIFSILYFKKPFFKFVINLASISIIMFFMGFIGFSMLQNEFPATHDWINEGFQEIIFFLRGDMDQGYFSYVTSSDNHILPSSLVNRIFGVGIFVLTRNRYGINTDIGFLNDIWLGGFIYLIILNSLILFLSYFVLCKHVVRKLNLRFIYIYLISALYLLNIKGHVFSKNNFTTIFWLLLIYIFFRR